MSKNEVASKKEPTISAKGAQAIVDNVSEQMLGVQKGYLGVVPLVYKLYKTLGFKALGYKNYDQMCEYEWGMSHGTASELKKVFDYAGVITVKGEYIIPEQYAKFGYTKLLMFAKNLDNFKAVGINPIEVFTPDMKLKEMSAHLTGLLEAKAKEQENNAIDTESQEIDEQGNEPNGEQGNEPNGEQGNEPNGEQGNETKGLKSYIIDNINSLVALQTMAKNEKVSTKDMALLEASIDYLRQFNGKVKK